MVRRLKAGASPNSSPVRTHAAANPRMRTSGFKSRGVGFPGREISETRSRQPHHARASPAAASERSPSANPIGRIALLEPIRGAAAVVIRTSVIRVISQRFTIVAPESDVGRVMFSHEASSESSLGQLPAPYNQLGLTCSLVVDLALSSVASAVFEDILVTLAA